MKTQVTMALKYCPLLIVLLFIISADSTSFKNESRETKLSSDDKIMACYYRAHNINDSLVPSDLCTHIIFAFGVITSTGVVQERPGDIASYRILAKLKDKNPKLKFMISLSSGFETVVGGSGVISFSLSAVKFLNEYNMDGFDIDWEFPTQAQKKPFADFITDFSNILHKNEKLLSFAMPNDATSFQRGYIPSIMNTYADFMTVMTYDFHSYSNTSNATDYNSALYTPTGDKATRSTADMINYYIGQGVLSSKMLIGFPTYGRSWELANASNHNLHAPAVGVGAPGPVTNSSGIYLIQDVCDANKQGGVVVYDHQAGAEYMYFGKTWVAFNAFFSARVKIDWLKTKNLRGVGVWKLDNDDPKNHCGFGPFPVLRKLKLYL